MYVSTPLQYSKINSYKLKKFIDLYSCNQIGLINLKAIPRFLNVNSSQTPRNITNRFIANTIVVAREMPKNTNTRLLKLEYAAVYNLFQNG